MVSQKNTQERDLYAYGNVNCNIAIQDPPAPSFLRPWLDCKYSLVYHALTRVTEC